jgi:hypothetical protein
MSNGHPNVAAVRLPPPFEVVFTVNSFRNLLVSGARQSHVTGVTITMPAPNPARCYLYPGSGGGAPSIRVLRPGAALRFRVVGSDDEPYLAVGVTFTSLANRKSPFAVACETGSGRPVGTPFGNLELVNRELFFADSLPGAAASPQTFTAYKFSVLIQRVSDGALGLIDPEVENEN